MKQIAIETKNLTMYYDRKKKPALSNASMIVKQGDIHGFIGPNGAGKTTLIKLLIGGIKAKTGQIKIFGKHNESLATKQIMGYVPERADFMRTRTETTKKYLLDLAFMKGLKKKQALVKIEEVAKRLEISKPMLKAPPFKFSSGQKKRVLVAQALLNEPQLLILDEPTANLDPEARAFMLEFLQKLNKKQKVTIFISSHILAELQKYVTGWTIINEGKIVLNDSFGLMNVKNINYEIISNNNNELLKLLKKHSLNASIKKDKIIVNVANIAETFRLQKYLLKSEIKIYSFVNQIFDLQNLYNQYTTIS